MSFLMHDAGMYLNCWKLVSWVESSVQLSSPPSFSSPEKNWVAPQTSPSAPCVPKNLSSHVDIIWTNRSILFSSPEKNLVPILGDVNRARMPLDAPTVLYLLTAVHQMHGEHVMQECGIDMHSSIWHAYV
jgi:hypothetical protein